MIVSIALFVFIGQSASARMTEKPSEIGLILPCVATSKIAQSPAEILHMHQNFDCTSAVIGKQDAYSLALYRGLNLVNDAAASYEYRHAIYQVRDEQVYVVYRDGQLARSPTSLLTARKLYSSGVLAYKLPLSHKPIIGLLIVAHGLQNERGFATAAAIISQAAGAEHDIAFLIIFAVLLGTMLALITYNIALFAVLRYPFLLAHCLSTLAILVFGLHWSGGIFYFFPTMSPILQISLTMLALGLYTSSLVVFMIAFIGRDKLNTWVMGIASFAAVVALMMACVRLYDVSFAWRIVDQINYGAVIITLGLLLYGAFDARRRGSRAANYYLWAWSVPMLMATFRAAWGLSNNPQTGELISISPLFIMTLETFASAFALSWRIGQLRDERDEARALQRHLKFLAETDPMTGLLNRRAFLEKAQSDERFKQFVLIDIDDFKTINDTFGHDIGDQVIISVAEALENESGGDYLVGRMGGEEFGIIINDLAPFLAQRMCAAISNLRIRDGLVVTASAGVAIGPINSPEDWQTIYSAADRALYEAKRSGRNRVCQSPESAAA